MTIDAMGNQTAIAQKVIDGEGDYILALKGNQGNLHEAAVDYIDQQMENNFRGVEARRMEVSEEGHGRQKSSNLLGRCAAIGASRTHAIGV